MRRLFTPRWLGLHLLAAVLVVAFCWLGWWQLGRGISGNARSYGYALEWPVFAVFVVIMWWRTVRDAVRPPEAEARAAEPEAAELDAQRVPDTHAEPAPDAPPEPRRLPRTRPVPDAGEQDPELAAYNRYLAGLNERTER